MAWVVAIEWRRRWRLAVVRAVAVTVAVAVVRAVAMAAVRAVVVAKASAVAVDLWRTGGKVAVVVARAPPPKYVE